MSKRKDKNNVPDTSLLGNLLGKADGSPLLDIKNPNADSSLTLLMEMLKNVDPSDRALVNALLQTYMQRGFDMEARDYNSVNSQIERLMAAGMSRTQAMLTATAGEAMPPQVADLATAAGSDADRVVANQQFAAQTAFNAVGAFANFFTGNYGAIVSMMGDSLVQNIGQEIYSWLPRGIEIPQEARANSETFKRWCLGILEDDNGNVIEPPQEARDLIRSKDWSRMMAHIAGRMAFDRYFNASYATHGYHEDLEDAKRFREMQKLAVVNARMQQFMNLPALYDTTLDLAMADLQNLSISISEDNILSSIMIPDKGWLTYDSNGVVRAVESDTSAQLTPLFFLNQDGSLRDDAPAQLRLLAMALGNDMATMSMLTDPSYISQVRSNLFANEQLKSIMIEADKIIQQYRRDNLAKAAPNGSQPKNDFIEMLQNLLTNYMLMTGGRSFIDDAGSAVGFGFGQYHAFRNARRPAGDKVTNIIMPNRVNP